MSQENVELVREATDVFNRLDLDAFMALLSPDVVWEVNPELPGLREVYCGPTKVREFQEELLELFESGHVEVRGLTELSDDRVFCETILTGRGKGSDLPVELHYWTVFWIAEGKIARRQVWMERVEALGAAGLSNVEVVRQAWKDFSEGGVDATLPYYAEDCVCEDVPELPDRTIYRGREGVRERSRRFREMWRDFDLEPVEFIDGGDDVVVVVTATRGHGRESDAPIESGVSFVYDIRDGRAIRDRAFMSRRQALEAAGLSE